MERKRDALSNNAPNCEAISVSKKRVHCFCGCAFVRLDLEHRFPVSSPPATQLLKSHQQLFLFLEGNFSGAKTLGYGCVCVEWAPWGQSRKSQGPQLPHSDRLWQDY